MYKKKQKETLKIKIYNFLENPKTKLAYFFHSFIFFLILLSFTLVIVEHFFTELFILYKDIILISEYLILIIFTLEYLGRFFTASDKKNFFFKPLSIVDLLAILPFYLEITINLFFNTTGLRLIRSLSKFTRVIRIFKILRFNKIIRSIFRWKDTIIQTIAPVMLFFLITKIIIWGLESFDFWFKNLNLGELFAIIGFALGIILSQKISTSHDKFLQVEEAMLRIYSNIHSLGIILEKRKPKRGIDACHTWSEKFLQLLTDKSSDNHKINGINAELYEIIYQVEEKPADITNLYNNISSDAIFCLGKEYRLAPKAYDTLLHQATVLYLFLIVVFIPGLNGLFSIAIATYILYGMYNLTQDLDSILGGDFNLINIDISEFKRLLQDKKWN